MDGGGLFCILPAMRQASSYGIVDRRLLFDRYLHQMSHKGTALYLFLVLAADRNGRSYYSDRSIGEILRLSPSDISGARTELIGAGLIDYQRPNWLVKNLSRPGMPPRQGTVIQSCAPLRSPGELQPVRGIVPDGLRMLLKSMEEQK